jgi:hypothetical protein
MVIHLILMGVLALVVGTLFMYRRWIDGHEDHNIHLHNNPSEAQIIHTQEDAAKKLDMLEKAIRYLTIALIVYGVAIAGYASYVEWISQ